MNPTLHLIIAMSSFVGTHLLLSHPLRQPLVDRIGALPFLGLYSLVAAGTLIWVYFAVQALPVEQPRWVAPLWFWHYGAPAIMLLVSILLAGSLIRNPASPDPRNTAASMAMRPATGVFAITRHPMNWSFILWGLTHIALVGTTDNLVIAAGVIFLAFFGSLLQDRKKRAGVMGDSWQGWESRTSFWPFAAILDGRIPWSAASPGMHALGAGLVIWLIATWLHSIPVGLWQWIG